MQAIKTKKQRRVLERVKWMILGDTTRYAITTYRDAKNTYRYNIKDNDTSEVLWVERNLKEDQLISNIESVVYNLEHCH